MEGTCVLRSLPCLLQRKEEGKEVVGEGEQEGEGEGEGSRRREACVRLPRR